MSEWKRKWKFKSAQSIGYTEIKNLRVQLIAGMVLNWNCGVGMWSRERQRRCGLRFDVYNESIKI
jgi:hypothetical protein